MSRANSKRTLARAFYISSYSIRISGSLCEGGFPSAQSKRTRKFPRCILNEIFVRSGSRVWRLIMLGTVTTDRSYCMSCCSPNYVVVVSKVLLGLAAGTTAWLSARYWTRSAKVTPAPRPRFHPANREAFRVLATFLILPDTWCPSIRVGASRC